MVKRKQKNSAVKIITEIWSAVLTCTYIIRNCADWFMHAKQCSQNKHRNMISCFNLHIYHSKLCWLVYAWSQNVWPSFNLSLRLFCNVYLSVHNCLNLFLISINVICFFHTVVSKKEKRKKKEQQWQHTHTHTNPSVNVFCFFHTVVNTLGSPLMWGAYHVDASTPLAWCRSSHVYRYIKDTYML